MGRERVVITDFSAGEITEGYAGRVDLQLYRRAAAELRGVVVRPDGGVTRRGPTLFIRSGAGIAPAASGLTKSGNTPGFAMFSEQDGTTRVQHLAFVEGTDLRIRNLQDHSEETVALTDLEAGEPLETSGTFVADMMGASISDQRAQFWTPGHAEVLNIPSSTTTNRIGKQIAAVFQNRLITADRDWGKLYFSVPLDLLNNDLTKIVEIDDGEGGVEEITVSTGALEIYPDFFGVESVRWIKARGSLYLGTDRAEYEVGSGYAAFNGEPGGVMITRISTIGTSAAEFFGQNMVMVKDSRVIEMSYQGMAESYQTMSLMELQNNAPIVQIKTIEYGSHRYLFALDLRRTLWCLTSSPSTQVSGWTRIEEDVWSIDSFDQDLFMVRNLNGSFTFEALGLDNLHVRGNRTPMEALAFDSLTIQRDRGAFVTVESGDVFGDKLPASTEVMVYKFDGTEYEEVDTITTQANGDLFSSYVVGNTFLGGDGVVWATPVTGNEYVSRIKTLPIEVGTVFGPGLGLPTKIHKIMVLVEETTAFRARVSGGEWVEWESEEPFSGPVNLTTNGSNVAQAVVEIESIGDHPMTILSIQADVTTAGEV
ncbi:MAG: hypothetical protein LAT56_00305 [Wenzhouxiangella sp.]|nr:hypothetical protein [Wenzhouxiangella sp.]